MSALDEYRRAHRALRREFAPLTEQLCAECPDPCCRVPARVGPFDVALAQAGGWQPAGEADPVVVAIRQAEAALGVGEYAPGSPCPFLNSDGCVFPADLRPLECAAFVCRFMAAAMDARQRARARRLVAEMRRAHARLTGIGRHRTGVVREAV